MFDRKLISISIASALLTSSLAVSANTQKEEDEDSVTSWGKWAQQYATAAGGEINTNALSFASLGQGETGRNGQNEPGFELNNLSCDAGSFCGFAVYRQNRESGQNDDYEFMAFDGAEGVGKIDVVVSPEMFPEGQINPQKKLSKLKEPGGTPISGSYTVTDENGLVIQANGLEGYVDPEFFFRRHGGMGRMSHTGDEMQGSVEGAGISYHQTRGPDVLVRGGFGAFEDQWDESGYDYTWIEGQFIGGITTSLSQLNDFVSSLEGRSTVTYSGWTFREYGTRDARLHSLTINFGDNSWDASFGGRSGFEVTDGQVSGINFSAGSDQLSARDAVSVTGSVNGAIFGNQAQSVGGMIDIVKTVEVGGIENFPPGFPVPAVAEIEAPPVVLVEQNYKAVFRGSIDNRP